MKLLKVRRDSDILMNKLEPAKEEWLTKLSENSKTDN